jgi:tetratricopeptide (TPR) repeat protein
MQFKAALALAVAGETNRADALARHLDGGSPQDTVVQFLYLPIVRAANALNRHDAPQAIESLRTTAPYEFSVNLMAVYFRGLGYLGEQKGAEAEAEFEKVINHSGVVLNAPIGSLAYLQLGRAYSIQGESEKARNAYHKFFEIWKDADQDVPILMISRQEYSKLH